VADCGGRLLGDRALVIGQFVGGLTDAQNDDALAAQPCACWRVLLDDDPVLAGVVSVETFDRGDQPERAYRGDRTSGREPRELWRNRFPMLGARRLARGDRVGRLGRVLSEGIEQERCGRGGHAR